MIEIKNLSKTFKLTKKQVVANGGKDKVKHAVAGIDFEVKGNEVFGLLGPNGAGKTTTLRCLATLIEPTSGQIIVDGVDSKVDGLSVRKKLAFLTNELKLDPHFTPDYTSRFFGRLHGLEEEVITKRIDHLFNIFGVTNFRHTKISDLSTGMKQKLSIVVSLIHDPQVIIFDEPTSGLDIVTAKVVTDYLMTLKAQGKTVIISTHMMHVAEKLCDRIAILLNGKIKVLGSLAEILDATGQATLEEAFFSLYEKEVENV